MQKLSCLLLFTFFLLSDTLIAQSLARKKLLFGVAYYDEYMPYDRLEKDVKMMKESGINVVRIAESTWSTVEPQDNVFDFSHIDYWMPCIKGAFRSLSVRLPTPAC